MHTETGWFKIRIMSPSRLTCLPRTVQQDIKIQLSMLVSLNVLLYSP